MAVELTKDRGLATAVAGGYAMQIYGSPRLTGDVDLVSEGAPTDIKPLRSLDTLTFGGRKYTTPEGVEVDLIVRSDHLRNLYTEALEQMVETEDGLPIIAPDYLAAMKFAAGRPKDEDDLVWLLQQEKLIDRTNALDIVERLIGGRFARDAFQSFIDEADWRTEREKKKP